MHRFLLLTSLIAAVPAQAEVVHSAANGFEISLTTVAATTPGRAWALLVQPSRWWNAEHSWSGDSRNLTLAPRAGGCFCEQLPAKGGAARGAVEHGRVIFIQPSQRLRLASALGPLQSEAVTGVLTFAIAATDAGHSKLTVSYVVGGYFRRDPAALAKAVDSVLADQLDRWRAASEGALPPK